MTSTTMRLFERWKVAKELKSDRRACFALGLSHGATVYWASGKNASADIIERMARDLGHSDAEIAGLLWECMVEANAHNAAAAKTWRTIGKALTPPAKARSQRRRQLGKAPRAWRWRPIKPKTPKD